MNSSIRSNKLIALTSLSGLLSLIPQPLNATDDSLLVLPEGGLFSIIIFIALLISIIAPRVAKRVAPKVQSDKREA